MNILKTAPSYRPKHGGEPFAWKNIILAWYRSLDMHSLVPSLVPLLAPWTGFSMVAAREKIRVAV
jgi:hypothetical protein